MEWGLVILCSAVAFSVVRTAMPCTWPDVKQVSRGDIHREMYRRGHTQYVDWIYSKRTRNEIA